MSVFYNEIEPYPAQWTRNLVAAGHVASGIVDERSIKELQPSDIGDATQAHFFAGIGVWSYALRLAGVSDEFVCWTGSCPCQPFSSAGKQLGTDDERHLWPDWFRLIRECRPPVIFGEQVEGAVGKSWLDLVCADLEGIGYAIGAAVLPAASVGAPHIRSRLYFMAYATEQGRGSRGTSQAGDGRDSPRVEPRRLRDAGGMAYADEAGLGLKRGGGLLDGKWPAHRNDADRRGTDGLVGDTNDARPQGYGRFVWLNDQSLGQDPKRHGSTPSLWSSTDWIRCQDGRSRSVEPGSFPLAHGATQRVGRLRAYGNSLCAPQAAAFIRAAIGALP